jgi:hypothetical protein
MLVIHGRRTTRIKTYSDHQHCCTSCKNFDLKVAVFAQYRHIYFIPIFTVAGKTALITCNHCKTTFRSESLEDYYKEKTRYPFYLYTATILFTALVVALVIGNVNTQKEKAEWVAHPKVGDVYLIRKDDDKGTGYFFLRISEIKGEMVYLYHNNLIYNKYISRFNDNDYFVRNDELTYSKSELREMLDKAEINSVDRDYGTYEGFDRIQ